MRDDLKPTSVDYVFTRPVARPAFIAFRYLSHVACAQVDFLFGLAVVAGIGIYREVPGLVAALPALLLGQILLVAAFSAFGMLAGMLTSRYIVIGLVYGAIVELGVGQIPTQLNQLSMTMQVRSMLHSIAPLAATETDMLAATAVLLAFASGLLAITAIIFTLRELSAPNES